ncbi:unnamed protein product [Discula destructiva]
MFSILRQQQRPISLSSDLSALGAIVADDAGLGQESLSQPSQPSRLVTVPYNTARAHDDALAVVAKIEAIFESMIDVLAVGGDALVIPYRRSRDPPERPLGSLMFPGRNVHEATKFTQMMRIMELSRETLMSGRVITKRNIYYQNSELFKDQTVVDRLVDDLACTLALSRNALNIVAASKGLMAGSLRLIMADGSIVSCASSHNTNSIHPIGMIHKVDFANTKWILVIEKEATFRTLAACQYWRTCVQGQGLIVTGKGYADLATLEFLNLIHTLQPAIPVLCVVDCDPHGIDIMRTYKHGSKGLGHEASTRIPGLRWLGVKMTDVFSAGDRLSLTGRDSSPQTSNNPHGSINHLSKSCEGRSSQRSNASSSASSQSSRTQRTALDSLIQLTETDRNTSQRIFRAVVGEEEEDTDLYHEDLEQMRELQVMLMLNMKAEIQAVDDMGDLSSWLNGKMEVVMGFHES